VVALDFDQPQTGLGMLGQQGTHQRRFTGATRAPEQGVVGRHAVDELLGIAPQLFQLPVDADQVGQTHVEADVQRQQKTAATLALPTCSQALRPVDGLSRCRQQRFDSSQNGIGAFKKSIQSGIHVFSSGTFTVMMALQRRNTAFTDVFIPCTRARENIGIHA